MGEGRPTFTRETTNKKHIPPTFIGKELATAAHVLPEKLLLLLQEPATTLAQSMDYLLFPSGKLHSSLMYRIVLHLGR